jgi:transcriptional regulator GlxA family with amidase domain
METANEPMNVGILIFDEVEVLDFCGPFEVFSVARDPEDQNHKPFAVFTIAEQERMIKARGGLLTQPHFYFDNHPPIDILVVPGGWGTRREFDNPVLIDWIKKVTGEAQINTSVCTGSFLLGKAGVLEGKRTTTHWASVEFMRQTFPRTQVEENVRYVDEGNLVTSAGVSAGIDMSLHVVEKLLGRDTAEYTARMMEYVWND